MQQIHLMSLILLLMCSRSVVGAVIGSLTPETLCVCPGDEATFTCSVEEPDGVITWITNATTDTCRVFSSSPQSQCGQFIGQLLNSSLSTLTATSTATSDTGNTFIQCYYITDLVGNATLLIADRGTPPPTPILHNVTSGDIQDNGDGDTYDVTLRWTLSEPDDCSNTIHFNVTPHDPTHCEVGYVGPGVQEEFSCQVTQGIGQSCTYRVYAVHCGDTQNGVRSEPVEVNITAPPVTPSSPHPPPVTSSSSHPPPVTSSSPHPIASISLQPTMKTHGEGDGDSGSVAAITGGVAGGVAVIVAIAAVVTGVLCYCHSRRQNNKPTSQQPEAEYEEIPGEAQGAIEMKENTAYGPVTPRGGPVYEVPGASQAANEGIETGGNIAYGHLHY